MIVALLLVAAGCSKSEPEIQVISYERWREVLAGHRGSVVVVNVWAGWCRSCVELFPSIVSSYVAHKAVGVVFISLCLDDHDDQAAIDDSRRFVVEQKATFPHYLLQGDISESFENLNLSGIPAVLVFDREGKLRHYLEGDPLDNEISPADVEDAVESLR